MNLKLSNDFAGLLLSAAALSLGGCGSDAHGPWGTSGAAPGAVMVLSGNAGDGAVSLGWSAPATGDSPFNYSIEITPAQAGAQIIQSGNSALIRNLNNGTAYSFTVHASNSAGNGPNAALQITPAAIDSANYTALNVAGNTSGSDVSGIFDPSLLRLTNGNVWMTYSSVAYYGNPHIKDVSTSLALSTDGGATFNYVRTPGNAANASVTDATGSVCGNTICSGRWVYEVPFIVDDETDPDSARRFKIFAHKYFLYPAANPSTRYELGAIVMWTASSPDGTWSAEESVLGWNLTPPELTPRRVVNTIAPALNECITISEGSASAYNNGLDFVFACSNGTTQKIVQLRSTDHANTFTYAGTLLEAADAATFNASHFSAPALITTSTNAQVLLATPVATRNINGVAVPNLYSGCIAFPLASEHDALLFRNNGAPLALLQIPAIENQLNGACTFERNTTGLGILMSAATIAPFDFGVISTKKNF